MANYWFLFYYYAKYKVTAYSGFQIYASLLTSLWVTQLNTALELLDKKP